MICQSCAHQQRCIPWNLARRDRQLQALLAGLDHCERRSRISLRQRLSLWSQRAVHLAASGRRGLVQMGGRLAQTVGQWIGWGVRPQD